MGGSQPPISRSTACSSRLFPQEGGRVALVSLFPQEAYCMLKSSRVPMEGCMKDEAGRGGAAGA